MFWFRSEVWAGVVVGFDSGVWCGVGAGFVGGGRARGKAWQGWTCVWGRQGGGSAVRFSDDGGRGGLADVSYESEDN